MGADYGLDAIFRPQRVAFVGGSNLAAALRYHRELGFAGETWVVNPRHATLGGYPCHADAADLPEAPDLAFIAIRREAAVPAIAALRDRGCRAVICNAAGFAEMGAEGAVLQDALTEALGPMAALGPNSIGIVNFVDPMAAIMDHFGIRPAASGVAVISQGGGILCDAAFADRSLAITHLVGCGNQARHGVADCADYLLDDPRVSAIGLAFEGIRDIVALRRAAAKAARLGKPMVALKLGRTAEGAKAAATHTASMAGADATWEALLARLGIVSTSSESVFFETLKLFQSGQVPRGRRVLVTAASGATGVMLADHLSKAGFALPQPDDATAARLRTHLPAIASPGNPQDVTMAAWNDRPRQEAIYAAHLDAGYDIALMVQNYPREGMWDIAEYAAQVEALAAAAAGKPVAAFQLAPLVDCFPEEAREQTSRLGLAPMQGLEECIAALDHAVVWRERREALLDDGPERLILPDGPTPAAAAERLDEAAAKALLREAGVPVPDGRVVAPADAAAAAAEIGFPVALKALDPRLLHKTEAGAVRLGLADAAEVDAAVRAMRADMAERAPDIPLAQVLVEAMAPAPVAEIMASVTRDPAIGPVMMIAGGGVEAELWGDRALLAAPFDRAGIARCFESLRVAQRVAGWRGRPAGDREALLDALEAIARLAGPGPAAATEIEINPIMVGRQGVLAVDAVLTRPARAAGAALRLAGQ
ncbi:MAG: acetate--CoA ligase family protein [Pseudomonadota bacterium]